MSQAAKLLFPGKITTLSVFGSHSLFPVRRVFCVGKNYADHVSEMGGSVEKDPPLYFFKPADAIIDCHLNKTIKYPPHCKNLHYEGELVVAIGTNGKNISKESALNHVFGYAVGVDMTARDLQDAAKKKGRPWDMAKGFDESGPCGAIVKSEDGKWYNNNHELQLYQNGKLKQNTKIGAMIWSIPEIISSLSHQIALEAGDIIYTGTPSGVGELKRGDLVKATCHDLPPCEFTLV